MKNCEKYKSVQARTAAFNEFCDRSCVGCRFSELNGGCPFVWLELEAEEEEKPLPCPFCGGECRIFGLISEHSYHVVCDNCRYSSGKASTESKVISEHNRVAKAANESEGK